LILCVLGVLCVQSARLLTQTSQIYGFTLRSSTAERAIERRFLALPSPDNAREAHAFLTAEPHVAGSPRDRALAEWVRDRWREYGLEQIAITEHEVLLPYATDVGVEMTLRQAEGEPTLWRASLKEDPVAGDPFSARDVGLPYHAYSASGDVTAPVVYAGGGNPADYDWLAEHGVDVSRALAVRSSQATSAQLAAARARARAAHVSSTPSFLLAGAGARAQRFAPSGLGFDSFDATLKRLIAGGPA